MKKIIYLLAFVLLILSTEYSYAQPTTLEVVRIAMIDSTGNGMTDAFEIEFNQPVDDASWTAGDWVASNDSAGWTSTANSSGFATGVSHIANVNVPNDQYVTIYWGNSDGNNFKDDTYTLLYCQYTKGDFKAYYNDTTLESFPEPLRPEDHAPPGIEELRFSPNWNGEDRGVGDFVQVRIRIEDGTNSDPPSNLVADTLMINNTYVPTDSIYFANESGTDYYFFRYWIKEGDSDQTDGDWIPVSVQLRDPSGNSTELLSTTINQNQSGNIDGSTPQIKTVTVAPGHGTTVGDGGTIRIDVELEQDELGLSATTFNVNSQDLSGDLQANAGKYYVEYDVLDGHNTVSDATRLPIEIVLSDGINSSAMFDQDDFVSDVTPGVDGDAPSIATITFNPGDNNTVIVGETLQVNITEADSEAGLDFSVLDINGRDFSTEFLDLGSGNYRVNYLIDSSDTDIADNAEIPFDITITDGISSDNKQHTSGGYDENDMPGINASVPRIMSVSRTNAVANLSNPNDTLFITIYPDTENYSNVTGKVAGYDITGFDKVNNTTIEAYYTITARSYDIPAGSAVEIDNLIITDEFGNPSSSFSGSINLSSDPIYSKNPSASISGSDAICHGDSIDVPVFLSGYPPYSITYDHNGTPEPAVTVNSIVSSPYYITIVADEAKGSPITFTISDVTDATTNSTTGTGSFVLTTYSLPNAQFVIPIDGSNYDKTIETVNLSGNQFGGVFSGNGVLTTSDQFSPSLADTGFHKLYYHYEDANGCKDSDSVTVEVIDGGTITFMQGKTIYCSYTDTFSVVGFNNLGALDGYFTLDEAPGAITNLSRDTAIIQPDLLTPGSYTLVYKYTGGVDVVRNFSVEEVNPATTFDPVDDYCEDYDEIIVEAKNYSPLGGDGYFTLSVDTVTLNPTLSGNRITIGPNSLIPIGPLTPRTYTLEYYYITPNLCSSDTITDSFDLNPLPPVDLTMEPLYDINGGTRLIWASPTVPAGDFSPGFMSDQGNGSAIFDPQIAGLGDTVAYYTYEDTRGCINVDSAEFTVNEAQATIYGLDEFNSNYQYCYFGAVLDTLYADATNGDGTPGTFTIDGDTIPTIGKDSIAIIASDYVAGDHEIIFAYKNGAVDFSVSRIFNIDSIGYISFDGLDANYCESDNEDHVLEDDIPSGGVGTFAYSSDGAGITNSTFNANEATIGDHIVYATFTRTSTGCQKTVSQSTTVNPTPTVNFTVDDYCVINEEHPVTYEARFEPSENIASWKWIFNNNSNLTFNNDTFPEVYYNSPGYKAVHLEYTTNNGCVDSLKQNVYFSVKPLAQFIWDNECMGSPVQFTDITDSEDIIAYKWYFGDGDSSDLENPIHEYDSYGDYDVSIKLSTQGDCRSITQETIHMRPSIRLSDGDYYQDFESDKGGWISEGVIDSVVSWEYGTPAGSIIKNASSGTNAWITNLTGPYFSNEESWVSSPCLDFSGLEQPMIKFDIFSQTEADRDGVLFQYTDEDGNWETLGLPGEGVNWYNSLSVNGLFETKSWGWSGLLDTTWRTARYNLNELEGRGAVRMRIVFGSDGAEATEGFAFDNIWIGSRQKLVLLENFTSINDLKTADTYETIILPLINSNSRDMISLNYHTNFAGVDELYNDYPSGPNTRSLYYGVGTVPYSVLDGGTRKFDYEEGNNLSSSAIDKQSLGDIQFNIDIVQEVQGNTLNVSARLEALEDYVAHNLTLHVAVIEKSVVIGDNTYANVLRKLLPSGAGTKVDTSWTEGDIKAYVQSWDIENVTDESNLAVIAFIQDEITQDILQAGITSEFGTITNIDVFDDMYADLKMNIYPNPSNGEFMLELNRGQDNSLYIQVINSTGMLVLQKMMSPKQLRQFFDLSDSPQGMYIVRVVDSEEIIGVTKIIKQ